MTREEVKQKLVEILQTIPTIDKKNLTNITDETDYFEDLGAYSTELINIVTKAENKFGIEFEDADIDKLGTKVGSTIDLVMRYTNNHE